MRELKSIDLAKAQEVQIVDAGMSEGDKKIIGHLKIGRLNNWKLVIFLSVVM